MRKEILDDFESVGGKSERENDNDDDDEQKEENRIRERESLLLHHVRDTPPVVGIGIGISIV